jgi:hypothetical protein
VALRIALVVHDIDESIEGARPEHAAIRDALQGLRALLVFLDLFDELVVMRGMRLDALETLLMGLTVRDNSAVFLEVDVPEIPK